MQGNVSTLTVPDKQKKVSLDGSTKSLSIPEKLKKIGMDGTLTELHGKGTVNKINMDGTLTKLRGKEKKNTINMRGTLTKLFGKEKKNTINMHGTLTKLAGKESKNSIKMHGVLTRLDGKSQKSGISMKGKLTSLNKDGLSSSQRTVSVSGKLNNASALRKQIEKMVDDGKSKLQNWIDKLRKATGNAAGGSYSNGTWHSIPQYATGGTPSHGSIFIAGESGAEVVGHLNGRTEVLNQSQMASVMYSAVYAAVMAGMANTPQGTTQVILEGDARGLFKAVQRQANNYTNMTGKPAFNF